jgi:single-strand DNA-binding protein
LWGKTAENAGQYLAKGRSVFVDGRLALETWDDKQTGQKRSKLKVVAESLQFLGSKPAQGEAAAPGSKPADNRRPAPAGKKPKPERDPDLDAEPEDVPF